MLNFNQFSSFRHYGENPRNMRIFSVVFTIAGWNWGIVMLWAVRIFHQLLACWQIRWYVDGLDGLSGTNLPSTYGLSANPMVLKKLVWHKSSIDIWPVIKSDGVEKLVWHNYSIDIRLVTKSDGV